MFIFIQIILFVVLIERANILNEFVIINSIYNFFGHVILISLENIFIIEILIKMSHFKLKTKEKNSNLDYIKYKYYTDISFEELQNVLLFKVLDSKFILFLIIYFYLVK